ncbi:MAG: DUF362 domain-containing protein [Acidobacteriota bacterium]
MFKGRVNMESFLDDTRVALVKESHHYCRTPPFHPSEKLPEWPHSSTSHEDNPVYRALRQLFYNLKLDIAHYGDQDWNPLSEIVQPGDVVVLKPNLVTHYNHGPERDTSSLVTHGSVIRAVLDYTAKALKGYGKIVIGDCPLQGTDWQKLSELVGLEQIESYFRVAFPKIELVIKDYRLGRAVLQSERVVERIASDRLIDEYLEIDLKQESLLMPLIAQGCKFGVSQYSRRRMSVAHTLKTNKYLMPRDFVYADVMINLPKMKSHIKAGITCALKNFVGINGHKDYLPHFCFGSPKMGGDEYPDGNLLSDLMWYCYHCDWELDRGKLKTLFNLSGRVCEKFLKLFCGHNNTALLGAGSWYGNDTIWRTIIDINKAYYYFDRNNKIVTKHPSRDVKYLAILDGLVGGEKEGPLSPSPIKSGIMMAAHNPLALDTVATAFMGFDITKIKQVWQAFSLSTLPLANFYPEDIVICSALPTKSIVDIYQQKVYSCFEPPYGFKNKVEYRQEKSNNLPSTATLPFLQRYGKLPLNKQQS